MVQVGSRPQNVRLPFLNRKKHLEENESMATMVKRKNARDNEEPLWTKVRVGTLAKNVKLPIEG